MRLTLALLSVLAVAIFGCGKGKFGSSAEGKLDHVLVATIASNPTKLDPAQVEDGDTIDVLNQIFEGLVEYNEKNELVGNLAESWSVTDDGLVYTFKLKKGVKFHSGREMTAEDVKYSWDRAAHPDVLSGTVGTETEAGYMSDIVGFEDVVAGRSQSISGVRVIDPYTLEVRIKAVRAYWPMYLQYPCYYVVDKDHAGLKPMVEVSQMVGTGPFRMEKFIDNQEIHMTRFDDYHKGTPKLLAIKRLVAKDAQNRLQLYQAGRADWVPIERQDKVVVDRDPELKEALVVVDRAAIWYVGFAPKVYEPFRDRRVRRAFAMAIDKDRIIKQGFDSINQKAEGIVPPAVPGHDPNFKGIQFNPEEAKRLLAEAGYPNGRGMPPLKMYYRADRHDPKVVSEMVAQDLRANLGITVELAPTEWKALLELRTKGELPFFHLRWGADYLDPQNFLSFMLHSNAKENTLGWSNQEFDWRCDRADSLPIDQQAERFRLYREAERIAVEDAIWIPIYFQRDLELVRPGVTGIRRSSMGPLPHTETEVVWSK